MLKKRKDFETSGEMIEVCIPDKDDILQKVYNEILDYAFTTTGPNDGRMLSVVRTDDIFDVMTRHTNKELQKY